MKIRRRFVVEGAPTRFCDEPTGPATLAPGSIRSDVGVSMVRHFVGLTAATLTLALAAHAAALTPSETARILAGLSVDAEASAEVGDSLVSRYASRVETVWTTYDTEIGTPMADWATANVPRTAGETIFYPFAGADFTTVYRFYPDASRYVLVALQPGGRVPSLTGAWDEREAIFDFFATITENFGRRGFFITRELNDQFVRGEELVVDGITPVLMVMAEREGFTVESVEPIRVNDDGSGIEVRTENTNYRSTWNSVRLNLTRNSTGASVTVDYLLLDLSNENLQGNEAHGAFITSMTQHRVLLKAASHLLQYTNFTYLRDAILANSPSVLQEESGVDYTLLAEQFDVTLFGRFTDVNTLFRNEDLQLGLIEAYAAASDLPELPFTIGYRKDAGSCLQVAVRR